MELKVQITREPVKKYDKQKFEVEVPCKGVEEGVTWKAIFTEDQLEDVSKQCIKKIEDAEPFEHIVFEFVWLKMRAKLPKLDSVKPAMFKGVDLVLKAFSQELISMQGLDKVKPKQEKLVMPK